jgi:hypothetical protein
LATLARERSGCSCDCRRPPPSVSAGCAGRKSAAPGINCVHQTPGKSLVHEHHTCSHLMQCPHVFDRRGSTAARERRHWKEIDDLGARPCQHRGNHGRCPRTQSALLNSASMEEHWARGSPACLAITMDAKKANRHGRRRASQIIRALRAQLCCREALRPSATALSGPRSYVHGPGISGVLSASG